MPRPKKQSNTKASPSYNNAKTYDSKHLDTLGDFTWYNLEQATQTYIITQLPSTKPNLAHYISTAINLFAKKNHLEIHASYQTKNNLLYLDETDFKDYFEAMKIILPTINEATQKLKDLFNDNKISSVNTPDKKLLDQLPSFTWYQLEQNEQTYIVTEFPRSSFHIARAINHYAKEKLLPLHASYQKKHNLLYLCETDFKAYFEERKITQPIIKEATQKLKDLFNDNKISSISVRDRNYLAKLLGFAWYQLEHNDQTYIVTKCTSNYPSLASDIANAINHYGKEKALPLHASFQRKNNLLYLSEAAFKAYFESIGHTLPALNQPGAKLIEKFSMSRIRKKYKQQKSLPKHNIQKQSHGLFQNLDKELDYIPKSIYADKESPLYPNDSDTTMQTNILHQFGSIISENNNNSSITTTTQSDQSSHGNCAPELCNLEKMDFDELYFMWEQCFKKTDNNNISDNTESTLENKYALS